MLTVIRQRWVCLSFLGVADVDPSELEAELEGSNLHLRSADVGNDHRFVLTVGSLEPDQKSCAGGASRRRLADVRFGSRMPWMV